VANLGQPRKLSGLKARLNLAWLSIPNVPLIEIHAVPAKQLAVFLLKGASAMVFLLRVNVFHYGLELTRAHRKRAISPLPEKTAIASVKRFDPFRGCLLYLFDELSLGNSSRQRRDNVNVIGNTPDAHEFGKPDDSRVATQCLHGVREIPTACDREFGLHDNLCHYR
jgi:hypothetical protein